MKRHPLLTAAAFAAFAVAIIYGLAWRKAHGRSNSLHALLYAWTSHWRIPLRALSTTPARVAKFALMALDTGVVMFLAWVPYEEYSSWRTSNAPLWPGDTAAHDNGNLYWLIGTLVVYAILAFMIWRKRNEITGDERSYERVSV